jgi:hypothetical protein
MQQKAHMKSKATYVKPEKKRKKIREMNIEKPSPESRLARLMDFLHTLDDSDFTGYVKINYSQGSIARVEKFEEVLKKC